MSRIRSIAKELVLKVWRSPIYGWLLLAHDRLAVASITRGTGVDRVDTLLITPSGRGNIGDQAMFDAIVAATEGPIHAVLHSPNALRVRPKDLSRVRITVLPKLVRGHAGLRAGNLRTYARALQSAARVYVPGADTIDGGHPHASLARLNLARIAAERGVRTVVQGFSWSEHAPSSATIALRGLAPHADIHPRDPIAARRLAASRVVPVVPSADVVFTYRELEDLPIDLERYVLSRDSSKLAVVNISGLISRRLDLQDDYAVAIQSLHDRGFAVVFLPHVVREGDDDLVQARALFERSGGPRDYLVEELLTPAQVKNLVSRVVLSITGRMHLAIMSLSHGTPAVTLATVGKVEGLYEMFDLPELVVQPVSGCGTEIVSRIDIVESRLEEIRAKIDAALPDVRALADVNFRTTNEGLRVDQTAAG